MACVWRARQVLLIVSAISVPIRRSRGRKGGDFGDGCILMMKRDERGQVREESSEHSLFVLRGKLSQQKRGLNEKYYDCWLDLHLTY